MVLTLAMGDAGNPFSLEGRHTILPRRSCLRCAASPAWSVPGRRRGPAAAVFLHRPPRDPLRQDSPTHSTPLNTFSTEVTRESTSCQACTCKERRPRTTPGGRLRRPLPGPREIPTLLQTTSGEQRGHIFHFETQALPVSSRCPGGAATKERAATHRRCAACQTRVHTADAATETGPSPRHI